LQDICAAGIGIRYFVVCT